MSNYYTQSVRGIMFMGLKYQLEGQGQKRVFLVHQRFILNSHRQTLDVGIVA